MRKPPRVRHGQHPTVFAVAHPVEQRAHGVIRHIVDADEGAAQKCLGAGKGESTALACPTCTTTAVTERAASPLVSRRQVAHHSAQDIGEILDPLAGSPEDWHSPGPTTGLRRPSNWGNFKICLAFARAQAHPQESGQNNRQLSPSPENPLERYHRLACAWLDRYRYTVCLLPRKESDIDGYERRSPAEPAW